MRKAIVFLIAFMAALPGMAENMSTAKLQPGWKMENGNYMVGLEIALEPGWKTYWRAPGDGGIPPQFDWTGSENLAAAHIHWPRPEVFTTFGMRAIGYSDHVILPVEVVPETAGQSVSLQLTLQYGVCNEVCVPASASSSLHPATSGAKATTAAIRFALDQRVTPAKTAGLDPILCRLDIDSDPMTFRAELDGADVFNKPYAVIETGRDDLIVASVEARVEDGKLIVDTVGTYYGREALELDHDALRLTLLGDLHAVEMTGCESKAND
ncbi:protein-disulfide reductase DsbD domain-containing protein [Halovulum sp. GXIMD14793]